MALFFAHGVGIDRRGGELRMAKPALHEIEGDALFDAGHAETVPQPLGAGLRACDARPFHHFDDARIGGFQAPRPEMRPGFAVADAVHQVKRIEQGGRDGNRAVNAWAALLPTLEGEPPPGSPPGWR